MPYAPSLITLIAQRTPYALQVAGSALAPAIVDGDFVTIQPSTDRNPDTVTPGTVALVALANPAYPNVYDRSGLFLMNADGDLHAGETHITRGKYVLLGTVTDIQFAHDNA